MARTMYALLRPTVRAITWGPFLAATGLGLAIVAIPAVTTVTLQDKDLTGLLRVAAVCAGLGVAFLLDDPAARSTATVPTSRLIRQAVRAGVGLPAVGAWWAAVLVITVAGAEEGIGAALPLRDATLEAGTIIAIALGMAVLGTRGAVEGNGSTVAAPGLLVLVTAMIFMPERAVFFVEPGDPRWESAHDRWALLLAAAAVGSVWVSRGFRRR